MNPRPEAATDTFGLVWCVADGRNLPEPWIDSAAWLDRMLAACAGTGIETVHIGTDSAAVARVPRVVEAALRSSRPPRRLIVPAGPWSESRPTGSRPVPPVPDVSPLGAATSLLELSMDESSDLPDRSMLDRWARSRRAARWGFGYRDVPELATLERHLAVRPAWVRFPVHLISPPTTDLAVSAARSLGVPVIAADPFAGGRLDGSLLLGSPLDSSARPAPSDWARVRRTWAPVLKLGFLTEGRRRTLPQAALQYVLGTPGIGGALVSAADPRQLEGLAPLGSVPPLSLDDRDRVDRLRGRVGEGGTSIRPSKLK